MKAIIIDEDKEEHPALIDNSAEHPNLAVTFSDTESAGESDFMQYRKRDSASPRLVHATHG